MPVKPNLENAIEIPPQSRLPASIRSLARDSSVEVAPRDVAATPLMASLLSSGRRTYVPFLPKADFSQTIQACRTLADQGYEPVAHLPARAVASRQQLTEWLSALKSAGCDSVLLVAGDRSTPAGQFNNTLDILESGGLAEHGFLKLGVAGHPTGHPVADAAMLDHVLRVKSDYAEATKSDMWIVSQFAFGSSEILAWIEHIRGKGINLPIYVGIAGPSNLRKLIAFAAHCGVEASARILSRRPGAARLLTSWSPGGLVHDLAQYKTTHPDSPFRGIHVFSFGGFEQTAHWLQQMSESEDEPTGFETAGAA